MQAKLGHVGAQDVGFRNLTMACNHYHAVSKAQKGKIFPDPCLKDPICFKGKTESLAPTSQP